MSSSASSTSTREVVLSLYRTFLRRGREIPSSNHRSHVLHSCRHEFRKNRDVSGDALTESILLGQIQLDNLNARIEHMKEIMKKEMLVSRKNINEWPSDLQATIRGQQLQQQQVQQPNHGQVNGASSSSCCSSSHSHFLHHHSHPHSGSNSASNPR